jgi:hypothetical protein
MTLPYDSVTWSTVEKEVSKMADSFPVPSKKVHSLDFMEWATEGYTSAITDVYSGFVTNQSPTIAYKTKAENICKSRIMYGGRRLADLLVHIFGTESSTYLQ